MFVFIFMYISSLFSEESHEVIPADVQKSLLKSVACVCSFFFLLNTVVVKVGNW